MDDPYAELDKERQYVSKIRIPQSEDQQAELRKEIKEQLVMLLHRKIPAIDPDNILQRQQALLMAGELQYLLFSSENKDSKALNALAILMKGYAGLYEQLKGKTVNIQQRPKWADDPEIKAIAAKIDQFRKEIKKNGQRPEI